jgi:hypothetical protein
VTSSVAGQRESGLYSSVCKLLLFLGPVGPCPRSCSGRRRRRIWRRWFGRGGLADGASGTAGSAHEAQALPVRRQGTAGTAGNPAGGPTGGRIDGTVTRGPAMQGDDVIRKENSPDQSKADKKIKSICKGC